MKYTVLKPETMPDGRVAMQYRAQTQAGDLFSQVRDEGLARKIEDMREWRRTHRDLVKDPD